MRKVITYGTFDLFHRGHYNILKRAKEEGDYLIVGVTGERYDAERGKLSVRDSLATRIENVKATGFADEIIVEEYLGQKISDILKYDIDVLVIGSDWRGKFDHLRKYCEVKYLERTKNISSTKIREERFDIYNLGIATDDLCDNDVIIESQNVSGIHVESVFAPNKRLVSEFCAKYDLEKGETDYNLFLDDIDIVYIKTSLDKRENLVRNAIIQGKNVICEAPISLDYEIEKELMELAKEKKVYLIRGVIINYLQAFGQLLWMARGNLIGDVISFNIHFELDSMYDRDKVTFVDASYMAVAATVKILGTSYNNSKCKKIEAKDSNNFFAQYLIEYDNAIASITISKGFERDNGLEIIGTNGVITVPDDWWRMGYFTMKESSVQFKKHYSSNFEGNGFRYLIRDVQNMIKSGQAETGTSQGMSDTEAKKVLDIINE